MYKDREEHNNYYIHIYNFTHMYNMYKTYIEARRGVQLKRTNGKGRKKKYYLYLQKRRNNRYKMSKFKDRYIICFYMFYLSFRYV